MTHFSDLIATDIDAYLFQKQHPHLLRIITCGASNAGKSTLIGYLQRASTLPPEPRPATREGGGTTDLIHRFFSTDQRRFMVTDPPGHDQCTRHMIAGASTADLAIVLIDASRGVQTQTRHHSYLAKLIGIHHVVVAVSKMDLVDYSKAVFENIRRDYLEYAKKIGIDQLVILPTAELEGDNICRKGSNMPWYHGPTLLHHLETVEIDRQPLQEQSLRMPVQWVNRSAPDVQGLAGTIDSGAVQIGQKIRVQPSGRESTVTRIVTADGDLAQAAAPQSITLMLADEINVARGDVISGGDAPAEVADQFQATVVWMHEAPMLRGRSYLLKIGTRTVTATVLPLRHKINVNTLEKVAAEKLELDDIGVVELDIDHPIAFDAYSRNRGMGSFILLDRLTGRAVGAGLLNFALRRSDNIHWQALDVNKQARQALNGHGSGVIWLTGLSGAGKSTIANALEKKFHSAGIRTYLLDGDNVRHGLNKDLGFTAADRVENIRRVAEVARLMVDAGIVVITAFISPFRAERDMARSLFNDGEFFEVYVRTPLSVAEERDVKGLYKKARSGQLKNFTGIDSPYEEPTNPEILIDSISTSAERAACQIHDYLARKFQGDTDMRSATPNFRTA